jgi:hypothetical protein
MRVRSDCYENFLGVRILGGTPRAGSVQKELRTYVAFTDECKGNC